MSSNLKNRTYTSISLIILVILMFKFDYILIYSLIILSVMAILEFLNLIKKILINKIYKILLNFIFIFYIAIICIICVYFFSFLHLKILIFIILFGSISSDIGGYIVGKNFQGPKLTKISPKKTISGALGSVIFTNLTMVGLTFYYTSNMNYNIFVIATVTSIACQLGDLLFSFLKRKAKIKDTGKFLPGHGGVLDRLDGILVGVPVGLITFIKFI